MRVAIDESRHDHPPGRIDLNRIAGFGQVFHTARGAYLHQHAVADQQRSVLNQPKFVQSGPAAGASGAAQREKLTGATDKNCPRLFSLPLSWF